MNWLHRYYSLALLAYGVALLLIAITPIKAHASGLGFFRSSAL
jgi:hypothetical protein